MRTSVAAARQRNTLTALEARVIDLFAQSARLNSMAASQLAAPIACAIDVMVESLRGGGKILACGNGGSAADAQHFAAEFVNRFAMEREPLAAIALTTDTSVLTSVANDYSFEMVFDKQLRALGRRGDVLLAISTSGESANVVAAIRRAKILGIRVVALTGSTGGRMAALITDGDVHISVPHDVTARIQEIHLLTFHCMCDGIETVMFRQQPATDKATGAQ